MDGLAERTSLLRSSGRRPSGGSPAREARKEAAMSAETSWQGARWWRAFALALFFLVPIARPLAASDPGVRGGAPNAGNPLPGLTVEQQQFFDVALDEFIEVQ